MPKAKVHSYIEKTVAYIDTVSLWTQEDLSEELIVTLNNLCRTVRKIKPRYSNKSDSWMLQRGYKFKLMLHQPSNDALLFLKNDLDPELHLMINNVQCALDFITTTKDQAVELQQFIVSRWLKPYHKIAQKVNTDYPETIYIGYKDRRNQLVTYTDKPSRHFISKPCCHIESRTKTKGAVESIGVFTIDDLLNFDHLKLWKRKLSLYEYNLEALGKLYIGDHLNCKSRTISIAGVKRNISTWTANKLCRGLNYSKDSTKPVLMDLVDLLRADERKLDPRRILKRVDSNFLLKDIEYSNLNYVRR